MECTVAEASKAERLNGSKATTKLQTASWLHITARFDRRLRAVAGSFRRSGLALAASASALEKKLNASRIGREDWSGIKKQ